MRSEGPFRSPLLAYTSAIENPGLELDVLRQVVLNAGLLRDEGGQSGIRQEKVESYFELSQAATLPRTIFRHKQNSFATPEIKKGFYFVPVSGCQVRVQRYIASGGQEKTFLRELNCTTVFWVDPEYIIMTLILDGRDDAVSAADLANLQHPRGLFVDEESIDALRGWNPLFSELDDLEQGRRNIGQLMGELLFSILHRYYSAAGTPEPRRKLRIGEIRNKSVAILRTSTFISTVVVANDLVAPSKLNDLANIISGYAGLQYKHAGSYVESLDVNPTPDLRALVLENRILVAGEISYFESGEHFNNGVDDWLTFGILTGEVYAYLAASHYRFHLSTEGSRDSGSGGLRRDLIGMVSLSTRIADPNHVQTPLLRKLISRMLETSRLPESLRSMRDNLSLGLNLAESVTQKVLSVLILVATVFLLLNTLVPSALFAYYVGGAVLTLVVLVLLGPRLLIRLTAV